MQNKNTQYKHHAHRFLYIDHIYKFIAIFKVSYNTIYSALLQKRNVEFLVIKSVFATSILRNVLRDFRLQAVLKLLSPFSRYAGIS